MNCLFVLGSALFLLLGLCNCSKLDDSSSSHSFRIIEEDGITIAETIGGPRYEGELFEYVPVLTLEPGDTEETMLFNPTWFTGDSEGWFYVYDAGNEDIVVFNPEGRFQTRFGRTGSGPGEFQLVQFLCTVGDMLYIFDRTQMRTTRFRRSGELVDMISTQQNLVPGVRVTALIPLPGDERLHLSSRGAYTGPMGFEGEGDTWCDVVRLTAAGDTVWTWNSDPISNTYSTLVALGGRQTRIWRFRYPYSFRPEAFYVPELGVVAMTYDTPHLDIIDLDGQVHHRIRIDMGDLSITEDDRKVVFDWYERIINDPKEPPDRRISMEAYRKGVQFGEKKAPWTDLRFNDRGYLYLTPQAAHWASPDLEDTFGYIVISPDGEYLGITKPPMGRTTEIASGRLLVNYSDPETGEFTLTVYSIRPIAEGLDFP